MGFRFRKQFSIFPGVKINLSKSGVSTSLGGHGATVNVGTSGKRTMTLGIPGTGLSYQLPLGIGAVVFIAIIAALLALLYFIFPMQVKMLLHWWQPKIF
ncbi:MAG: DUF4236 domain-containing protein [Hyphomicrobiaceae bacterium]|nr:DUF4236 domain-containing protein [Hyphomicrobiaceae bacterium]